MDVWWNNRRKESVYKKQRFRTAYSAFLFLKILLPCGHVDWCLKFVRFLRDITSPDGRGCRIHRLLLCRGVRPHPNKCPAYDTKQSDGEVPAMLELWGMQSTPSLPSLPGPLWPGVVAPDKGPIYGSNRTNGILMQNWIVWVNWIAWKRNVFHN